MARYMSRDTEPLTKWRGLPIYLTTILTALFVVGLLVSAVLASARSPWMRAMTFETPVGSWTGWLSILSYPFIELPSFFTPLGIICFYWWAAGIESHLGRGPLIRLLAILVLVPVALLSVMWLGNISYGGLSGQFFITAGLLVAFAALYPNAEWAGWVPFKYLAFACILCGSLLLVADRSWLGIANLWLVCIAAFLYVRYAVEQEYDDHVPLTTRARSWFQRKPALRIVSRTRDEGTPRTTEESGNDEFESEVDVLLEKIARHGLASLSSHERARLEQARENLLRKKQE